MNLLKTSDIDKAYKKIKPFVTKTPLITNETINSLLHAKVYFKLENLQQTGSFKIRGASYKISLLSNREKEKGVVAYSSGNHAQAVAFASKINGIDSMIIMPKNAPKIKIDNTKNYGANVILYDPLTENREKLGMEIAFKKGKTKTLIKPYDDLDVIAGQGTVGKEIAEQLQEKRVTPDIYLCCCGGGGLIAGSSFYLKKKYKNIKNYCVEPEEFSDTQLSLQGNRIISNSDSARSICDALQAPQPGKLTFSINRLTLMGGLTVSDYEVKKAIKKTAELLKIMVEPGGAVAIAALLSKKIEVKHKTVVVMLSGGNVDYELFSTIVKKEYE